MGRYTKVDTQQYGFIRIADGAIVAHVHPILYYAFRPIIEVTLWEPQ